MPKKLHPKTALETATSRLDLAEAELSTALEVLPQLVRADKQMVGGRMRRALDEIAEAKDALAVLREAVERMSASAEAEEEHDGAGDPASK